MDYRDFDNVRDNLVTRELRAALNEVFADFDPLNPEKANTRIAEQRAKTAEAEAKANEILSKSVSNDPNVLVGKCLDAVRESGLSPLGCWPGSPAVPTVLAR